MKKNKKKIKIKIIPAWPTILRLFGTSFDCSTYLPLLNSKYILFNSKPTKKRNTAV